MLSKWWNDLVDGVVYPVRDRQWFGKSWPLLLIPLIPVLGFLAIILMKGWRLHMIRNMGKGQETLPASDLRAFFRDGLILWGCTFIYLLVPAMICTILGIGGPFGFLFDVSQIATQGTAEWAADEPGDWLASLGVYLLWIFISLPVYHSGVIRFARSGSWRSMLNIPANFLLFSRYIHVFILHYVNWLVLVFLVGLVDGLLALTVVGLPLVPAFAIVGYHVVTAHELGKIAARAQRVEAGSPGHETSLANSSEREAESFTP